jgi:YVTN family beta-propeller protein
MPPDGVSILRRLNPTAVNRGGRVAAPLTRLRPALALLLAAGTSLGCAGERAGSAPETEAGAPVKVPAWMPVAVRTRDRHANNVYAATTGGALSAAARRARPLVYVPASAGNRVDVIDPRTYKVVRRFKVGLWPQHITPSWDFRRLYVNNTQSDSLTEIDPRTGKRGRTFSVRDPYNLYFTPDGSRAIVVAERYQSLDFRDPKTWKLIRSVRVPWPGVDHLDFTRTGRYLFASTEFSGMVARIDVKRMRLAGHVRVGGLPVDVKLAPDGSRFYVANQSRGGVSIVDPGRMKEVGFVRTGRGAHGLCVSRNARLLYVSNRLNGTISVIDPARRRVRARWRVGGSPDMLQVSPDGRKLWVSDRFHQRVTVVGTRGGHVLRRIEVGPAPHGLAYFPQPGRYSLGHNGVYR